MSHSLVVCPECMRYDRAPQNNSAVKGLQGFICAIIDQIEGQGSRGLQAVWADLEN